jgi:hypothetical protein
MVLQLIEKTEAGVVELGMFSTVENIQKHLAELARKNGLHLLFEKGEPMICDNKKPLATYSVKTVADAVKKVAHAGIRCGVAQPIRGRHICYVG